MARLQGANLIALAPGSYDAGVLEKARSAWGIKTIQFYRDAENVLFKRFKVRGVPHTVILDAAGKVKEEMKGYGGLDSFRKALEGVDL